MNAKQGREGIVKIMGLCNNGLGWACDADQLMKILTNAGWASPETLASEYVRLDMVVEGKMIPANCAKGDFQYTCDRGRCRKCPDHIESRPATARYLIGGKQG